MTARGLTMFPSSVVYAIVEATLTRGAPSSARPYQPKYYPQPKTGTGFVWTHTTTGDQHECKGVEWYLDYRDAKGKRQRRKVHSGYCTSPPKKKGVFRHEQFAIEALAAVISSPVPVEAVLEKAELNLSIEKFAAEYPHGHSEHPAPAHQDFRPPVADS